MYVHMYIKHSYCIIFKAFHASVELERTCIDASMFFNVWQHRSLPTSMFAVQLAICMENEDLSELISTKLSRKQKNCYLVFSFYLIEIYKNQSSDLADSETAISPFDLLINLKLARSEILRYIDVIPALCHRQALNASSL